MACDPLTTTNQGKALVVTDEDNCQRELVQSDGGAYPAIAVAVSDGKVVLRDGSEVQPINLPHLQVQTGGAFTKMLIQDESGNWFAYTPSVGCVDKRLVVRDGSFEFVDDTLPSLVTTDLCEITDCEGYDFLLGVKEVSIACGEGEDNQTYLQIVLVPKDLCPTCEA